MSRVAVAVADADNEYAGDNDRDNDHVDVFGRAPGGAGLRTAAPSRPRSRRCRDGAVGLEGRLEVEEGLLVGAPDHEAALAESVAARGDLELHAVAIRVVEKAIGLDRVGVAGDREGVRRLERGCRRAVAALDGRGERPGAGRPAAEDVGGTQGGCLDLAAGRAACLADDAELG
jgi:hypothetical protein